MGVYIQSYNQIKFGELRDLSISDMILRLFHYRSFKRIDAVITISSFVKEIYNVDNLGLFVKKITNLDCSDIYNFTNGTEALNAAYLLIKSKTYKKVLIVGLEKLSALSETELESVLASFLTYYEADIGQTYLGKLALFEQYYLNTKKVTKDTLYKIASMNSRNGINNRYAQFRKEFPVKHIQEGPYVCYPTKLFETATFCDGAAYILISNNKSKFEINDLLNGYNNYDLDLDFGFLYNLKKNIKFTKRVDVIEVSDVTSFIQYVLLEKLNLRARIINSSGGFKSCGNPIGASLVRQVIDLVKFLKKEKKHYGIVVYQHGCFDTVSILHIKNNDKI